MHDHPLAYTLFLIGTAGGVLEFSTTMWLVAFALGFAWLMVLTVLERWR